MSKFEEFRFGRNPESPTTFDIVQQTNLDDLTKGESMNKNYELFLYNVISQSDIEPDVDIKSKLVQIIDENKFIEIKDLFYKKFKEYYEELQLLEKNVVVPTLYGTLGAIVGYKIDGLTGIIIGTPTSIIIPSMIASSETAEKLYLKLIRTKKVKEPKQIIEGTYFNFSFEDRLIDLRDLILLFGTIEYSKGLIKDIEENINENKKITSKVTAEIKEKNSEKGKSKIKEKENIDEVIALLNDFKDLLGYEVSEPGYLCSKIEIESSFKKYSHWQSKKRFFVGDIYVERIFGNRTREEIKSSVEKTLNNKNMALSNFIFCNLDYIIKACNKNQLKKLEVPFYLIEKTSKKEVYGIISININNNPYISRIVYTEPKTNQCEALLYNESGSTPNRKT